MSTDVRTASERLLTIVMHIAPLLEEEPCVPAAAVMFREALRPDIMREIVETELASIAANRPPSHVDRGDRTLRLLGVAGTRTEVRLVPLTRPPSAFISTLTRNSLVGNAGRAPFVVRRWLQPQPYPNDVFDPSRTLHHAEDITLAPGEAIGLRAGYDAYDVVPIERTAVILSLAGPVGVPLAWLHRREDGRPVRAVPAGRASLRLLEVITFADSIGNAALLPALRGVATHPSHFVRWAAAKTALRIAPHERDETLRVLAADEHPQVRTAAEALRRAPVPA
jgi:hypothetical protein